MFKSKRMLTSPDATDSTIIALNCQENYLLARNKGNTKKAMFIKQNEVQGQGVDLHRPQADHLC